MLTRDFYQRTESFPEPSLRKEEDRVYELSCNYGCTKWEYITLRVIQVKTFCISSVKMILDDSWALRYIFSITFKLNMMERWLHIAYYTFIDCVCKFRVQFLLSVCHDCWALYPMLLTLLLSSTRQTLTDVGSGQTDAIRSHFLDGSIVHRKAYTWDTTAQALCCIAEASGAWLTHRIHVHILDQYSGL